MSQFQEDSSLPTPIDISSAAVLSAAVASSSSSVGGSVGGEIGADDVSSISSHSAREGRRPSSEEPEEKFDELGEEESADQSPDSDVRILEEDEEKALYNHMFSKHPRMPASHDQHRHLSLPQLQLLQQHPYFTSVNHQHVRVKSNLTDQAPIFKDNTRIVQEIGGHEGGIWCMKFSPTGQFFCTAGEDAVVRIWCVANYPPDEVSEFVAQEYAAKQPAPMRSSSSNSKRTSSKKNNHQIFDFLQPLPYRELYGHEDQIIDVAWSKSQFLLSASLDRTVRLWHVTLPQCLQKFFHEDIVTAVEFHPHHDRYFVSGCWDRKIRVWDIIPEGTCLEVSVAREIITSVCFNPDGKLVVVGLMKGKVNFYDMPEFDSLTFKTEMVCRNKSGKYKSGTKVTGLCYQPTPAYSMAANNTRNSSASSTSGGNSGSGGWMGKLLVTTNDSRVRLCKVDDYTTEKKYKGVHNKSMQIKSSFSQSGTHFICGSEDGSVVVWNYESDGTSVWDSCLRRGGDRTREHESFANHSHFSTTAALFAPSESVLHFLTHNAHVIKAAELLPDRNQSSRGIPERGFSRESTFARAAATERTANAAQMIRQMSHTSQTQRLSADEQRDLRNAMNTGTGFDDPDVDPAAARFSGLGDRADSAESADIGAEMSEFSEFQRLWRLKEYSTRFIVTADRIGMLRVYARIGNTEQERIEFTQRHQKHSQPQQQSSPQK